YIVSFFKNKEYLLSHSLTKDHYQFVVTLHTPGDAIELLLSLPEEKSEEISNYHTKVEETKKKPLPVLPPIFVALKTLQESTNIKDFKLEIDEKSFLDSVSQNFKDKVINFLHERFSVAIAEDLKQFCIDKDCRDAFINAITKNKIVFISDSAAKTKYEFEVKDGIFWVKFKPKRLPYAKFETGSAKKWLFENL